MKLFFIYDSSELRELGTIIAQDKNNVQEIHVLTIDDNGRMRFLYEVATEVRNQLSKNESSIIFINQYLTCADNEFEWIQNNAGIALIKFLRILDVNCHIVLITPIPYLELIKQSTHNLIATSKGISVAKYLKEFRNYPLDKLNRLASDVFDEMQDIEPFILAEFSLPEDYRHNWANWWGIYKLLEVHKHFDKEYELFVTEYKQDTYINYILQRAPNIYDRIITLEGQEIKYLYGFKETDFQQAIMNKEISDLHFRLSEIESEKIIQNTLLKNLPNATAPKKKLSELEEQFLNIKKDIDIKRQQGQSAHHEELIRDSKISSLRQKLKQDKPRILLIDDQAEDGWSEIFQHIIYGESNIENTFKALYDFEDKSIEEVCIDVISELRNFNPALVLLDLRLKKEIGTWLNVSDLSGALVLDRIRKIFPGLPVMMTTASNKAWTYSGLMKTGADALWIKEGVDISKALSHSETIKLSVENYEKFLDQVVKLTGEEYKLLHWFTYEVTNLKANTSHWWAQKNRFKKGRIPAQNPQEIFDILDDSVLIIRDFLQVSVLKNRRLAFNNDWFYPSLIIQNLGKIIEKLHHNANQNFIIRKDTFKSRMDECGLKLFEIRNDASHVDLVKNIKIETSSKYIKNVMAYLKNRDYCISC